MEREFKQYVQIGGFSKHLDQKYKQCRCNGGEDNQLDSRNISHVELKRYAMESMWDTEREVY